MARKLKSDKVLFLATLLLVCASVVMVYSASAVLAMQRYNQPYLFLIKQGMWAALGLAAMSVAMRFDYRNYREPSFIWMSLGVVSLALHVVLMSASYRRRRLMAFWNPWSDPLGDGFQIIQSLIAVGAGGVMGRGFMAGVQKLFYLPEPHTDFIYAVIGEELGLIGTTIVLL